MTTYGGYRVVRILGEGGQGVVYLGEGADGTPVAIKVLHARLEADQQALRRFTREVDAARRVAPFSTARVLEVGVEAGAPYVVSEYVPGPSLKDVVDRNGPRDGDTLVRLAISTATALDAIHGAGVVHRDVKPSNVLIGPDGPRMIDFGIARAWDTVATQSSAVVGTPAYMSPEQIAGQFVGPPSDIFSWASTLVFAATGVPAFGADSIPAILHRILHDQPDLSAITPPLRDVIAAALAKDPNQRPAAADILPALIGHVHWQESATLPALVRRGVSRRAVLGIIGGVGVLAAGGVGAYFALSNRTTATLVATLTGHTSDVKSVAFSRDGRTLASADDQAIRLWNPATGASIAILTQDSDASWYACLAFCRDGSLISGGAQAVDYWDVATGRVTGSTAEGKGAVQAVALSPDGSMLASGSNDSAVRLSSMASKKVVATLTGHTNHVVTVAYSPDGAAVASGSLDGTARLWNVAERRTVQTLKGNYGVEVTAVAFSPDGSTLAYATDNLVEFWDTATRQVSAMVTGPNSSLALAYSPDGSILAGGNQNNIIQLWRTGDHSLLAALTGHTDSVCSVAFSPDGKLLASASGDKTVKLWRLT